MNHSIKTLVKKIAHHTVLRPPYVRYCSQTIYQSLLGSLRLWEATQEPVWRQRAEKLLDILIRVQRPDGGFDIGYDFNFGQLHRTGESTSPELVGLVALAEFERCFDDGRAVQPAQRCANWIAERVVEMGPGLSAIPYAPYSTQEVMVYNGVSFAAGALGRYLAFIEQDAEYAAIYQNMIRYLYGVMHSDHELKGKFWYYSDQDRTDLSAQLRNKIDYYHQMQQVEMHALAQQARPLDIQLSIVREAADHITSLSEREEVIPYTNDRTLFQGNIHLWGMASIVPGMLEAAQVLPQRAQAYQRVARKVLEWLIQYGWNGRHFAAILDPAGRRVGLERYMVRSDAWVFNALAAYTKHQGPGEWHEIAEQCFLTMEAADFSGLESHASTKLSRSVNTLMRVVLN